MQLLEGSSSHKSPAVFSNTSLCFLACPTLSQGSRTPHKLLCLFMKGIFGQQCAFPTTICLSYPVLHSVVVRGFLNTHLWKIFIILPLFFPEEGRKAESCNDRKESKKMKMEIHRIYLGGKFGTILLEKIGRKEEEDRNGIVETYLGSSVKLDVNTVVLSLVKRGCLSFSWAPPAALPHLPSACRGEAKAWPEVHQPYGLPQALLVTGTGCVWCFRGEWKQIPHPAVILCPSGLHSHGAQRLWWWCGFCGTTLVWIACYANVMV